MDAHESAVNAAVNGLSAYQFNLVQGAYAKLEAAYNEGPPAAAGQLPGGERLSGEQAAAG